LGGSTTPQIYW